MAPPVGYHHRTDLSRRFRASQGQGLGELLLLDAIHRSGMVLEHVGVHALFADANDAKAAAFYRKYGFRPLPDQPLQLVLVPAGLG
jgi:ribosomal protein S18 acetylase RimI-like enzyme